MKKILICGRSRHFRKYGSHICQGRRSRHLMRTAFGKLGQAAAQSPHPVQDALIEGFIFFICIAFGILHISSHLLQTFSPYSEFRQNSNLTLAFPNFGAVFFLSGFRAFVLQAEIQGVSLQDRQGLKFGSTYGKF